MARTMTATQFKAECLRVLDEVAATGEPVTVAKRGKPVAKVTAVSSVDLRGSVRILVSEEELLAPIDEPWDAES